MASPRILEGAEFVTEIEKIPTKLAEKKMSLSKKETSLLSNSASALNRALNDPISESSFRDALDDLELVLSSIKGREDVYKEVKSIISLVEPTLAEYKNNPANRGFLPFLNAVAAFEAPPMDAPPIDAPPIAPPMDAPSSAGDAKVADHKPAAASASSTPKKTTERVPGEAALAQEIFARTEGARKRLEEERQKEEEIEIQKNKLVKQLTSGTDEQKAEIKARIEKERQLQAAEKEAREEIERAKAEEDRKRAQEERRKKEEEARQREEEAKKMAQQASGTDKPSALAIAKALQQKREEDAKRAASLQPKGAEEAKKRAEEARKVREAKEKAGREEKERALKAEREKEEDLRLLQQSIAREGPLKAAAPAPTAPSSPSPFQPKSAASTPGSPSMHGAFSSPSPGGGGRIRRRNERRSEMKEVPSPIKRPETAEEALKQVIEMAFLLRDSTLTMNLTRARDLLNKKNLEKEEKDFLKNLKVQIGEAASKIVGNGKEEQRQLMNPRFVLAEVFDQYHKKANSWELAGELAVQLQNCLVKRNKFSEFVMPVFSLGIIFKLVPDTIAVESETLTKAQIQDHFKRAKRLATSRLASADVNHSSIYQKFIDGIKEDGTPKEKFSVFCGQTLLEFKARRSEELKKETSISPPRKTGGGI